jgi:tetratricopeptide (TPR) repeat protein
MSDNFERLKTALADRYRLIRELGAGGMATVYLAEDLRHHRQVAVKVLREDLGATIGPERFQREIEIAARIHHPHILPLYDSGEAGGFLFYVMPYVEGESLRGRLNREGELPVADAVRILREVADALAKAHAQGVVHRDIKPDNVMLADRHALVADFGVAKAVSDATDASGITTVGVALGTPSYMAPEQAAADPNTDHRADIYAFGVLAYEMLTGEPPFTGKTAQQVLAAHMTEAPAPVTRRRQSVPEPLAELVMRCLEKKPADRWQTADQIVTRLETIATPSGGMAPTQAVSGVSRSGSGRPLVRYLGVAAVLVAAVIGVWVVAFRGKGGPTLDANLVAVLPFRIAGTNPDIAYLREGVVDIMATLLTGEEGTARAADPASVITGWRKRGASETTDLDASGAEALARDLGAGKVLSGSIIGDESKLTIRASLAAVGSRSEPLQATVEGPADSLSSLLRNLAGRLLAQSAGVAADQSAGLLTSSLPALRAYLRGQAEYRQGRYAPAITQYAEALQADSNFALAGAGLTAANGWIGFATPEQAGLAQRTAWRNRDRLGPKDRALVIAQLGPNGPGPDYLSAELRAAERATEVAPDRAESWYMLGDDYMHNGRLLGIEDALERAEQGLRRALERDSLDSGVLSHLLMLVARRQDTAEVKRIAGLRKLAVAGELTSVSEDFFVATFLGDTAGQNRVLALMDTAAVPADFIGDAQSLAFSLSFQPNHLPAIREYMDRLARRTVTDNARNRVALLQTMLAWDAGQPSEASSRLGTGAGRDVARILAALFWSGDTTEARQAAERLAGTRVTDLAGVPTELATSPVCAAALWDVAQGRTSGVPGAAQLLRETARTRDPAWPPTINQVCATLLETTAAQINGQPQARAMVDSLDRLLQSGPALIGMSWQNLAVAGLLEKEGQYARAAAAARRTRQYYVYIPFLATYYREAGRLAERAGERDRAIEGYARYLDLRKDAEPALQEEVNQVKQALARLTAEKP